MPTLAIFLHQLAATGVARNAVALGRHMRQAGWRTVLITVRPGGELASLANGLEHVVLGGSALPRKLELLAAASALRREVAALGPDVVMSAGNHAHMAMVPAMSGLTGLSTVYRISNDLAHGARVCDPLAAISPRRLIAHRVVRDATRLVLVSPHLADDPLLAPALRNGKARVIANGVDGAMVRRRAAEACNHPWAAEDVPIVLAVGRLAKQKNLGTLVEAFALARAERRLRLLIVGTGPHKARETLQDQASRLGVANDVAFVGQVENPFPYYRAATVLVLPSMWEGSPNVLLEALACDVPVVASNLAGNARSILDDGRFGMLVDPLDAEGMARSILAQVDSTRRIRPNGRAAAFDRSQALEEYRKLLEELAGPARTMRRAG